MISELIKILNLPTETSVDENKFLESKLIEYIKDFTTQFASQDKSLYKKSLESLFMICKSLVKQGKTLLAIKQVKRFLFAEPFSIESHMFISLLYAKFGNFTKSSDHLLAVRFITSDSNYDAKIASLAILNALVSQICKIPLELKSKSLVGYKITEELTYDETGEYHYPYYMEDNDTQINDDKTDLASFITPLASCQINVGDLLHVEQPYALSTEITTDLNIQTNCFHCLMEREIYNHAFSCPIHPQTCPFVFCRWECMIKHSRRHELECDFIGTLIVLSNKTILSTSFLLLVLRCLIQGFLDIKHYNTTKDEVILKCLDLPNYKGILEIVFPELLESFEIVAETLMDILPINLRLFLSKTELIKFFCVIYSHKLPVSFTSPSSSFNSSPIPISAGWGFFYNTCKFQHSCIPTCVYYLNESGNLCIRSAYNLPENMPLTISYLMDLFIPTQKRKSISNSMKVFSCMCARCMDDTENNCFLEGIRCFYCIIGFFVPSPYTKRIEATDENKVSISISDTNISRDILNRKKEDSPMKILFKKSPDFNHLHKSSNKTVANDLENSSNYELQILCERARINTVLGDIQIRWKCNNCGETNKNSNKYCVYINDSMEEHYELAINTYINGDIIESRRLFENLIESYSLKVHRNHYLIYNSRVYLVGMYNATSDNNAKCSFRHCKSAVISANYVYPVCYYEKVHLLLNLVDSIYSEGMLQKVAQRGSQKYSTDLIMESLWLALCNSLVCYGSKSSVWYYCIYRLRLYASILNIATPPSNMRIRITAIDMHAKLSREVLGHTEMLSGGYLTSLSDYSGLVFTACRKGHLGAITQLIIGDAKDLLLNKATYLPTGFNLLGMAASNIQSGVCQLLLDEGADIFFSNEFGITPLHALCNSPYREDEVDINDIFDKKSVGIARDMIRRASLLDSDILDEYSIEKSKSNLYCSENFKNHSKLSKSSNRYKLLYSKTIKWLGANTPLHLAASNGRRLLCSELVHGGTDPNIENIESAIPLHLASLNGHYKTVKILIRVGSEIDHQNFQGNTPLFLSMYGLKPESMKILLENGANINHQSQVTKMNILHCLVLGLCCNVSLNFQLPKKIDDLPLLVHSGYNNKNIRNYIYSIGTGHTGFGNILTTKVLSIPVHTPLSETLYISPKEMLIRIKHCNEMISYLMNKYGIEPLLSQKDINGYTPWELLDSSWNIFLKIRSESMLRPGLWYTSLSENDKNSTQELWTHAMQRIENLIEILKIKKPIYDENLDDTNQYLPILKPNLPGIPPPIDLTEIKPIKKDSADLIVSDEKLSESKTSSIAITNTTDKVTNILKVQLPAMDISKKQIPTIMNNKTLNINRDENSSIKPKSTDNNMIDSVLPASPNNVSNIEPTLKLNPSSFPLNKTAPIKKVLVPKVLEPKSDLMTAKLNAKIMMMKKSLLKL
ncbi:uncharacterized protein CMU_032930 [Cryptosporidium muris RN66]|uniref:SET domain-containing protein n=1 Tax=Cryptosporidium muris (strain RN66) TaxID=441375 RepID=B6AFB7_CRYMR|nr:uncharacterized protein CMU_032930 [Cryptosporidium muris RN66]EEA06908.1 hypothetical protein, conserved [Cryptosporidium muris RN66]|eukprot:XP_002141257.1 hypothetical protein [Cryptosporidium muris RN66]